MPYHPIEKTIKRKGIQQWGYIKYLDDQYE